MSGKVIAKVVTLESLVQSFIDAKDETNMGNAEAEDAGLRAGLKILDERDDVTVTSWEASFIEDILYKKSGRPLTQAQRNCIRKILENYE